MDAGDPAGEGEDSVTGDGEDETRGGDDGDGRVLRRGQNVLWGGIVSERRLTSHRATMQMMFMKTWPPLPRTTAYRDTNGWGEPNEKSVSASGWSTSVSYVYLN